MFALVCLIMCISLAYQSRIKDPKTTKYIEQVIFQNYTIVPTQFLIKEFDNADNVFQLKLKDDETNQTLAAYQIDQYQELIHQNEVCINFARSLEINKAYQTAYEEFSKNLDDKKFDVVFTDFAILAKIQKIYLLRSDHSLFILNVIENKQNKPISLKIENIIDLKKFMNGDENSGNPRIFGQIVCEDQKFQCYIFYSTIILQFDGIDSSKSNEITKVDFGTNKIIQKVFYNKEHNAIYIAAGIMGIEVWIFGEKTLQLAKVIDQKLLKIQNIFIVDVTSNKEGLGLFQIILGTLIFALDADQGIYVIEVKSLQQFQLRDFTIEIKGAKAFDFHDQTFFVIASNKNRMDYALEVFVDLSTGDYYFNSIYMLDMQLKDVYVHDKWAVLIGQDTHSLVYHSIYKGFMESGKQQKIYFDEPDLVRKQQILPYQIQFEEYKDKNNQHTIIGLSYNDVSFYNISSGNPFIKCQSNQQISKNYTVTLMSTTCKTKSESNDKSHFSHCEYQHHFNLKSIVYLESSSTDIILTIVVIVITLCTLILCIACISRWNIQGALLELQSMRLGQQKYLELGEQKVLNQDQEKSIKE